MVRAVTLIPGTTEFGYLPQTVVRALGPGQSAPENRHVSYAASDFEASLDELQALCPNLERVARRVMVRHRSARGAVPIDAGRREP
jgi:hypothetical protein